MVMSETIKDQETSSEQGNAKRRRLVRGAMALAPLVLTLRSGALAAASCTAARVVDLGPDGKIPEGSVNDVSCINDPTQLTAPVCDTYPLTGKTKVTTQGYPLVSVQKRNSGNSENFYCGDITDRKQVAIFSSAGNTSILEFVRR
jgi:hypothetical protein